MGLSSQGLARRLSKLRAMSAREIATRVVYRGALAVERRAHAAGTLVRPGYLQRNLSAAYRHDGWRAALLDSRGRATERFFPAVREQEQLRRLFDGPYARERAGCLHEAAMARESRFEFFGGTYQYAGAIAWQDDPVTGSAWPRVYHADVPVHGGDVGFGDVKHVWELSRQQYLIDLAKSHFITGDEPSLAAMKSLVRGWIAGNPYGTGVNWACALEPAFRAWSWLWAYHLTAPSLDDEFHLEWLEALHLHGRFLARHLEHYSSPYNHLIGEASALYAISWCLPEFSAASRWRTVARAVLERRLPEQFYEDGGTSEQSTFYHHATLGFYLLSALLARINGEELPAPVWRAVERGLEFSMRMMQPDGRTPEIGGADDGKPIRLEHLPLWDFRPYLAIGAVVLGRPDFKAAAGRFFEDALWLLGSQGLTDFESMPASAPEATAVLMPASGYFVARSDWSARADYLCLDAGEQAAGMRTDAVPNSMHGHADCLSIVLALDGRRVLVDSGLFAYNCGGPWEAHFRETAAHNTARIDGRDQALHLGKMAWSNSYRATIENTNVGPEPWAVASHDGYARGPQGVRHRRAVWLRPGHYVIVRDEFEGSGTHTIEVNYQFAPGALTVAAPGVARFDGGAEIAWLGEQPWESSIHHGGAGPDEGWICPSLGVRVAAPRLRLTFRGTVERVVLLSVLAATTEASRLAVTDTGADGVRAIRVAQGSAADWITPHPAVRVLTAEGHVLERKAMSDARFSVDETALAACERRHAALAAR